ncbi:ChaN family lipoprotein [Picosynechococcus sp. PCC 73109]|uniref:ChaN family lipoprotein n=1 Tax=Picosynechococcus sp. PCC 73109 TaxID=374982 RepID=UPI000745943D|nr:ChaN family lipoprotein [Picosynechococcus sp. PCC 73109]AMA09581.1 iron-regulated protein [Picosynechococcus sp. PCC 73109]
MGAWRRAWGWLLWGSIFFYGSFAYADDSFGNTLDTITVKTAPTTDARAALATLKTAQVIYLGEHHTSEADHIAQLEIIKALHDHHPQVAIAMEMFQRPFQGVLDQYIAGEISEADLVAQTEYETRWGFDWELYAPILRFAQEKQIPVIALNAPNEVVRQVSSVGLASLEAADFEYLPPREELDLSNESYQALLQEAFTGHGQHGNFDFDNFFAAQVVWDETMAEAIANFAQRNPNTQIITLAGQGHVIYGYGIPERVQRRLGENLKQEIVLLNPNPDLAPTPEVADLFWWTEAPTIP